MRKQESAGKKEPRPIWIVSELYFPEETSTGYILTQIAEGLAQAHPVKVLCGQPSYFARGTRAPARESRHNVDIRRCWGTTWNKDVLLLRLFNLCTLSWTFFWALLWNVRRGDRVLVVTNPPTLPFVVAAACALRGAQRVLLVHDVYPDVAVAAGLVSGDSLWMRWLSWAVAGLYKSFDAIIVLGRDMQNLVQRKLGGLERLIRIIPNWSDLELVHPAPRDENALLRELGLNDKFVVQYAGNMGRSHNLESVAECAEMLRGASHVHFLLLGSGAKKAWLEKETGQRTLTNITILPHRPRSESQNFLNACDVSLISFVSGMAGISVPSRLYNVLAAGKPIIAIADSESELAQVVREESVGWVVSPNDVRQFAEAIVEAEANRELLRQMSRRARAAAESKYRLQAIIDAYVRLFADLDSAEQRECEPLARAA